MDSRGPVRFDGGRAEEFGEFAGALAPQKVHLEEALLGVDESEAAGDVGAVSLLGWSAPRERRARW